MTEKNTWDIEQLKRQVERLEGRDGETELRLRTLESFKDSTVEKLIVIFAKLDELQEGDRWIKRVFVTSLVGGITTALISFVVWAIQN